MKNENQQWLIWSNEHSAWWRPNSLGYVYTRKDAGRYSFEDAAAIVKNANYALDRAPNEAMVLDDDLPVSPKPHFIDPGCALDLNEKLK